MDTPQPTPADRAKYMAVCYTCHFYNIACEHPRYSGSWPAY